MLRITTSKSSAGAAAYFDAELSRGDYYAEKGELAGKWHGNSAELLGLSGNVTRENFAALAGNYHPETGEQLTPRQRQDRRAGYDFTFSAPKSVSAFYEYLQGTDRTEQAAALLEAFNTSVRDSMAELEKDMRVRVRAGGAQGDRVTGNLVWAEFTHFQARPVDGVADPHLHTHAYAMNLTHDGQGWKAGEFGSIKRDATYYQEAFHARLGHALHSLGYGVVPAAHGFQLAGVERTTIDKFSRRTAEVEKAAAEKGIAWAEDKARQGAATRKNKDEGLSPEETRARFLTRLSATEHLTFERIAGGGDFPPSSTTPDAALDYALLHSFERASAVSEKRLMAEALKAGVGSVLPEALAAAVAARADIVHGEIAGERMATTREVLDEERSMLAFARQGRAQHMPFAGAVRLEEGGQGQGARAYQLQREWLSEEQREAVRHILTSTDRVIGIRGGAGTGKTAMMQEAVEAIETMTGKRAVVLAPSAEASRGVLRQEGFSDADTVARFVQDGELQAKARDGVIFVDEAGLLGSRDMHSLFRIAGEQNARVVLQGDVRQHTSVARGDALRLLEQKGGCKPAELKTIRRQKPEAYREAIAELAEGNAAKGFARLDAMGAVIEAKDSTLHARAANAYLEATARKESALVVSPTHAEGAKVTALIREGLKARGALAGERTVAQLTPTGWTEAERGRAQSYASGQVITFHQNAKGFVRGERGIVLKVEGERVSVTVGRNEVKILPLETAQRFQVFERKELPIAVGDMVRVTQNGKDARGSKVNNGATYRVEGFSAEGRIVVKSGAGGTVHQLPAGFGHLAHGYVTTSHASQGKTVDRVFIAQSAESFAASSREQFYVSASRGRGSVHIFTDDKAELARAIERSGARVAASDLALENAKAPRSQLYERVRARALELARKVLSDRWRWEHDGNERAGVAVRGWPQRGTEPEPAR